VDGADPAVDRCMRELRELLRDGELDDRLAALVPRLERAVLDTDRGRRERIAKLSGALHQLTAQLLALPLPADTRKPLKRFARRVDERAAQTRELPGLLGELSGLQARALASQQGEQPAARGLLGKLFGRRAQPEPAVTELPATEEAADEASATGAPVSEDETVQQPGEGPLAASSAVEYLAESAQNTDEQASAEPAAPPVLSEQAYSAIAEQLSATLCGLLDEMALPERYQAQAVALRERIQHGLNWYELPPVLDDLAVLMISVTWQGKREFENYLQLLNDRLQAMQQSLAAANAGQSHGQQTAQALDDELRQQVGGLQDSMREATDLTALKAAVQTRLDGLLDTVDSYQQQRSAHEQQQAARMQELLSRVATLEEAASGLHEHLAEQREKALQDSLTELPNRAAWDERLALEAARWERYPGELLLAVLDVDHFKRINDSFGHLSGDRVLKIIAGELRRRLRKTDFIARFGGEEFALLLPGTQLANGVQLLEELRVNIQQCPFHFKGARIEVTFSAGITAFGPGDSAEGVFERADRAMYRAKDAGRNRVEAAD
jgi:diguanylate cyclase